MPLDGLADEMLSCYIDWRAEARSVAETYREWCCAPAGAEASCFVAYMSALDREEEAARMYAGCAQEVERALSAV